MEMQGGEIILVHEFYKATVQDYEFKLAISLRSITTRPLKVGECLNVCIGVICTSYYYVSSVMDKC